MLIGKLVKDHISDIFRYCETQDRDELFNLMNKEYSKKVFGINFPFCKEVSSIMKDDEYIRFWKADYVVRNKTLRVSSQWVIGSKDIFLDYLLSKSIISREKFEYYQNIVKKKPVEEKNTNIKKTKKDSISSDLESYYLSETELPNKTNARESILSNFNSDIRQEAKEMSRNYELLYCLEKSMRNYVLEIMADKYGFDWWDKKVNFDIKKKVDFNRKNELNTGHTQLSDNEIDYTTFGDLRQIVESNWSDFSDLFKNKFAFNRIMYTLNQLRGPLAHSNYLTEDEVTRLHLTIKDWFRLVEK